MDKFQFVLLERMALLGKICFETVPLDLKP